MSFNRKQTNQIAPEAQVQARGESYAPGIFATIGLALFAVRYFVPAESASLGDTLWLVVLWLVASCLWFLAAFRNGDWPLRWDRYDATVWLLVAGHLVAAGVVLATMGHKRAALNMLFEWIGVGLAVSLLRRWLPSHLLRQQVAGVVCVSCVLLAGLGVWQFAVWMPSNRALVDEFQQLSSSESLTSLESARLTMLQRELGSVASGNDPVAREALIQRLLSTEPIGRFALTNTLAGLLAVGVVLICGSFADSLAKRRSRGQVAALGVCVILVAFCLVLTKSRTAWLALLIGLGSWASLAHGRRVLSRRMLGGALTAGGLIAAVFTAGVLTGGIDRFVVSESLKSMRYRLEYWRGTWGVITEHPFLGVGPGNFRQHYLKHKLPASSEEILDPHNLFLDAWANGGLMALAGLLAVVVLFVFSLRLAASHSCPNSVADVLRSTDVGDQSTARWTLMRIGVCGLGLACFYLWGMVAEPVVELLWLLIAWIALSALLPCFTMSEAAWKAAGVVLLVHLLAAGGLGMPAICVLLLLLLAPGSPAPTASHQESRPKATGQRSMRVGPAAPAASLFAVSAVGVAAVLTIGFVPVYSAGSFVGAAEYAASVRHNPELARRDLRQAVESDPLDPTPWMYLAQINHQASLRSQANTEREFESATTSMDAAIARDPVSPKRYWILGQWQLDRAQRTDEPALLVESVRNLKSAAGGYPNHSGIQASLAEAIAAAGDADQARIHASRALELDNLNRDLRHFDRLLSDELRLRLKAIWPNE